MRATRFWAIVGPGIVECKYQTDPLDSTSFHKTREKRGDIVRFSAASRLNLRKSAYRYPWHELDRRIVMVTLTYPADFPMDGNLVKAQFESLVKRWLRQWGERPRGMWVIEFQERGAPHFHMICGAPKGVEDRELRDWGFNAWTALLVKDGLGYAEADCDHRSKTGARAGRNRSTSLVESYLAA